MSAPGSAPQRAGAAGFLGELRRRGVVRVALVYLAAAFAALQAADILVPALHLPAWVVTLVVVLLALGLPLALALAWVLELTPEGVRVTPAASDAVPTAVPALLGRRTLLVSAGLVLAGIAFGAGWALGPDTRGAAADNAALDGGRVSVAVLPFTDLSAARDQEYLGDGIAEELVNVLVRSDDVAVASRTSSFSFKGRTLALPVIARELGVDHIVEGSVRRSGDRLRITAQLVDVRADRSLWSESFDRAADDIFRVQDEIAAAIAGALRVRLARSEWPVSGTADPEAYDLYLLGLYHWNKRSPEGLLRALEVFRAATERDPGYARAWAGLSLTYRNLPGYAEFDLATARREARAAAERAVQLDPRSAEARTALGGALWFGRDYAGAHREYERAIELDPSFATAHHWLGIMLSTRGQLAEGEAALRRALALDPASLPIQSYLGLNLDMQHRTEEALAQVEALLLRAPEYRNGLIQSFWYGVRLGRAREFEHRLAGYLASIGDDPALAAAIVDGIEEPARRADAVALVDAIARRRQHAGRTMQFAVLFAFLEAYDEAIALIRTEEEPISYLLFPVFEPLADDPRFQALLHEQSAQRSAP